MVPPGLPLGWILEDDIQGGFDLLQTVRPGFHSGEDCSGDKMLGGDLRIVLDQTAVRQARPKPQLILLSLYGADTSIILWRRYQHHRMELIPVSQWCPTPVFSAFLHRYKRFHDRLRRFEPPLPTSYDHITGR